MKSASTEPTAEVGQRLVTRLAKVHEPESCHIKSLADIWHEIRACPALTSATHSTRQFEAGTVEYKRAKKKLPAALFAGEFDYADKAHFVRHSGLMVVDFDHLPDTAQAQELRDKLAGDPHTVTAFVSPSQLGVKWIVGVQAGDVQTHKDCWNTAAEYALATFGHAPDDSGSDVSRKCFLCHDPQVLPFREPAERFHPFRVNTDTQIPSHTDFQTHSPPSPTRCSLSGSPAVSAEISARIATLDLTPYLPTAHSQNHELTFTLARWAKKQAKEVGRDFSFAECKALIERWYSAANPAYLSQPEEDYFAEFIYRLGRVLVPLGEGAKETALQQAKANPPECAKALERDSPALALLASFCFHLAAYTPDKMFFLSARDAGRAIGLSGPAGAGYLKELQTRRIIQLKYTFPRGERKATIYQWIGG